MNDPHVAALIYRVEHSESADFEKAVPTHHEFERFNVTIENGTARFEMKDHFATADAARKVVDPFASLWALWDAMGYGLTGFRLAYLNAEIIDRDPPPPVPGVHEAVGFAAGRASVRAVSHVSHSRYPEPPPEYAAASADVEVMACRYWMYRNGHDTLAAMAYFCLTVLEDSTGADRGRRQHVCDQYAIDRAVRNKLGELTGEKGGRLARKFDPKAIRGGPEHSASEEKWIEAAVRLLIRRAAEYAEDSTKLRQITMDDLPSL